MPRNVTLQVLRGVQANIPILSMGELFFATDTGNLFLGTPGFGVGYVQIGDVTGVNETLNAILLELRALRAAVVVLVCADNKCEPTDFAPDNFVTPKEQEN